MAQNLADQRLIDVLNAVAQAAGWETRPSPSPTASTRGVPTGRGVAMANAIFDATGVRLRSLPFEADNVRAAFAAAENAYVPRSLGLDTSSSPRWTRYSAMNTRISVSTGVAHHHHRFCNNAP
jgi:hypothetical protein